MNKIILLLLHVQNVKIIIMLMLVKIVVKVQYHIVGNMIKHKLIHVLNIKKDLHIMKNINVLIGIRLMVV